MEMQKVSPTFADYEALPEHVKADFIEGELVMAPSPTRRHERLLMRFVGHLAALLGPGKTGMDLVNALSVEKLTQVLVYHVAQGDRHAQGVVSSGQVKMLDGNFAPITSANGKFYIAGAEILATDIIASNGIIHVIGFVMVPPGF